MRNELSRLVLIRHGESQWNHEQRFTGWADVGLTEAGEAQMRCAAVALREAGIAIDLACSSILSRCIRSLWILLEAMDCVWVPQVLDWRLNERHYGALTGQLKPEAERRHGKEMVLRWRRSYTTVPPPLDAAATVWVPIDGRYAALPHNAIPQAESLEQTVTRVSDFWMQSLSRALRAHRCVAVIAHGNSLRALIKIVEALSDDEIVAVEVPNGAPIVYDLDAELKPLDKRLLSSITGRCSEIL